MHGNIQTPSNMCVRKDFTLEHVLLCPKGGFPSIRLSDTIRSVTLSAQLMSEVCHNVLIEPDLQPITGEPP